MVRDPWGRPPSSPELGQSLCLLLCWDFPGRGGGNTGGATPTPVPYILGLLPQGPLGMQGSHTGAERQAGARGICHCQASRAVQLEGQLGPGGRVSWL